MDWYVILVLVLTAPMMLLAVAYVWYLCFFGIYAVVRETQRKRAARLAPDAAQASTGASGDTTETIPDEKMYVVCRRCSRTVDAGRDGRYLEPVFVPGYCKECARFLVKRAMEGEIDGRLDGFVLAGVS